MILNVLFWFLFILTAYTYFGYPALIYLLARCYPQNFEKESMFPTVSFITVAYNEAKCIREKIENSLSLNYPRDKLNIIFASDGSTDLTDNILSGYKNRGIGFLKFDQRRGKAACLNDAVSKAQGEILIFSDANVIYQKDAIRRLVRNFIDNRFTFKFKEFVYNK